MEMLSLTTARVRASFSAMSGPLLETLDRLGEHLREEIPTEDPEAEPMRRWSRKNRRVSIFRHLEPYREPRARLQLTLAQKAEMFRLNYPEKWEKRERQMEEERKLSLGIVDTHPVLEAYVEAQMKRVREKKLIEAKRRLLPRTITVEIKHSPCKQPTPTKGLSMRRKSDTGPELSVFVVKGKNLFNHSGETEERSDKCCVRAALCPDQDKDKNKSDYRYLTISGTTRWEHIFTYPILNLEQMESKYIIISVTGVTRAGEKKLIGNAVLAGKDSLILMEDYQARKPVAEEIGILEKAFKHPDEPVFAQLQLYPKDWTGIKDLTIVQLERPPPPLRRASMFGKLGADDVSALAALSNNGNQLNPGGEGGLLPTTQEEGGEGEGGENQDGNVQIAVPTLGGAAEGSTVAAAGENDGREGENGNAAQAGQAAEGGDKEVKDSAVIQEKSAEPAAANNAEEQTKQLDDKPSDERPLQGEPLDEKQLNEKQTNGNNEPSVTFANAEPYAPETVRKEAATNVTEIAKGTAATAKVDEESTPKKPAGEPPQPDEAEPKPETSQQKDVEERKETEAAESEDKSAAEETPERMSKKSKAKAEKEAKKLQKAREKELKKQKSKEKRKK